MRAFVSSIVFASVCVSLPTVGGTAAPAPKDDKDEVPPAFAKRFGPARPKAAKDGGGSAESEKAIAAGLEWLAKQQKANGSWVLDGSSDKDVIAGTGLGVLPFLGCGQARKPAFEQRSILDPAPAGDKQDGPADGKYQKNVAAAIAYLLGNQQANGTFKGSSGMYSHAIATLALCEAYATSGDPKLREPAQKAVNFIVAVQGANGSWGYPLSRAQGDTSIVGWQAQALYAATRCPKLLVPAKTVKDACAFLDTVSDAKTRSLFGYSDRNSVRPSLTAVGLLTRAEIDGWGPNHDGMAAGVAYLVKNWKPTKERFDMYYYYYATQVLHGVGGDVWTDTWNPKMRDMLVGLQVPDGKKDAGSWDPDTAMMGSHCGRLGTTSLALLTLEVYYRYTPFAAK